MMKAFSESAFIITHSPCLCQGGRQIFLQTPRRFPPSPRQIDLKIDDRRCQSPNITAHGLSSIVIFIGIDAGFPAGRLVRKWLHSTHWSCALAASSTILAARQANANLKVRHIWRMLRMTRFISVSPPRYVAYVPSSRASVAAFSNLWIMRSRNSRTPGI